jgi:hypothetical protein
LGQATVTAGHDHESTGCPAAHFVFYHRACSLAAAAPTAAMHHENDWCITGLGGGVDVATLPFISPVRRIPTNADVRSDAAESSSSVMSSSRWRDGALVQRTGRGCLVCQQQRKYQGRETEPQVSLDHWGHDIVDLDGRYSEARRHRSMRSEFGASTGQRLVLPRRWRQPHSPCRRGAVSPSVHCIPRTSNANRPEARATRHSCVSYPIRMRGTGCERDAS